MSTEYDIAKKVANEIQKQFADIKLNSEIYVSKINDKGARIVE